MKQKTLINWLVIDSILIMVVGIYMAFLKDSPLFVFKPLIDPYFWPDGIITDPGTAVFRSFIYSLCGVVMLVWGIIMYYIVKNAVAKHEIWAVNALIVSTCVWFPIDEFFSVKYSVWVNAIFNIPFFLILIIPLVLLKIQIKNK
jgi:hypothetical protein